MIMRACLTICAVWLCATAVASAGDPSPAPSRSESLSDDRPRQYRPVSIEFPDSAGKRFFGSRVLPVLAVDGCLTCHTPARGDVHPAIQYEHLLPYLAMGQSATDNVLIMKLANQRGLSERRPAHVGGQRCTKLDAEPCKTIRQWWQIEFGRGGRR